MSPPTIFAKKRPHGRGPIITTRNADQEYRLLFYWLKSKIEAITWGLSSVEREFLSEITIKLADGRTASVGEVVVELMGEDRLASLPFYGDKQTSNRAPVVEGEIVDRER